MESCRVFFLYENAGDFQSCYLPSLAAPLPVRGVLHSGRPRNELHIDRKLCGIGAVEKQRRSAGRFELTKMFGDLVERVDTDGLLPGQKGISMPMQMANREVDGVYVVTLEGRIVLGEESHSFRERMKRVLAEGKTKIVLNMANIKYIDSSGLGALVAVHYNAKTQGASMCLCNLREKFYEVLLITKLLTVFDVYDTEVAAINSFQGLLAASN